MSRLVVLLCSAAVVVAACSGSKASPKVTGFVLTARSTDAHLTPQDVDFLREGLRRRFAALGFEDVVVDVDSASRLLTVRFRDGRAPSIELARVMVQSAELEFRLVLGTIPYSGEIGTANGSKATCRDGVAVTPDRPLQQVILPDKDKVFCYLLGPTILTGRNIGQADAVVNTSTGAWQVDVTFENDDFVNKVAQPNVGKQIAIVLDGVVQSAPTINPGITGRNVTITGNFSSKEAHQLALMLRYGSLPVHLDFVSLAREPG